MGDTIRINTDALNERIDQLVQHQRVLDENAGSGSGVAAPHGAYGRQSEALAAALDEADGAVAEAVAREAAELRYAIDALRRIVVAYRENESAAAAIFGELQGRIGGGDGGGGRSRTGNRSGERRR